MYDCHSATACSMHVTMVPRTRAYTNRRELLVSDSLMTSKIAISRNLWGSCRFCHLHSKGCLRFMDVTGQGAHTNSSGL